MDLNNVYRFREYFENELPVTKLGPKLVNTITTSAKNEEEEEEDSYNSNFEQHLSLKEILNKEITNPKHLTTLFMKTGDIAPLLNLDDNLGMAVDLIKIPGVLNEQDSKLIYGLSNDIKVENKDKLLLRDPKMRLIEIQNEKHAKDKGNRTDIASLDGVDGFSIKPAKIDASKANFLMRTEYSTNSAKNIAASLQNSATLRNKAFIKQQKTQKKLQRLNGTEFVERIQKSFQKLDTLEDLSLKNFKHPTKPRLQAKKIWKLLPDAASMDESFVTLKLNGSAAIIGEKERENLNLNSTVFRSVQIEEDEWMSLYSLKNKKLNDSLLNEQEIEKNKITDIKDKDHTVYLFNRIRDFNVKEDATNENNDPEIILQFNDKDNTVNYKVIKKQLILNKRRNNDLLKDIIKENNFDKLEVTYTLPSKEEQIENDNIRAEYDPIEFPKI
ncbi:hypothetical protein QEN19_003316 [Hanseniaspora menglaensis]